MSKYSVEYKKKVLAYLDKNGIIATKSKFGHNHSVIYRWKQKGETMGFMRKENKMYSREEKLNILNYYWKFGRSETEREFDISNSTFYKWERLFKEYGPKGLDWNGRGRKPKNLGEKKDLNNDPDLLAETQRLRMENLYLKKLDALVQKREELERKKKQK